MFVEIRERPFEYKKHTISRRCQLIKLKEQQINNYKHSIRKL